MISTTSLACVLGLQFVNLQYSSPSGARRFPSNNSKMMIGLALFWRDKNEGTDCILVLDRQKTASIFQGSSETELGMLI
jgi:hypothetical protein